jgi:hypothetical protein|nr:MAG TPA: hypothetical protein [Caudoviricetes sp.]
MLDEFVNHLKEVKESVREHHSAFVRKNFSNALKECEDSLEAALSMIGGLFLHEFITMDEYVHMSSILLSAHAKYLEFIEGKIPD